MKYREIMTEAIANRPTNMKLYLTNRIRDLDRMIVESTHADELYREGRDGDYLVRYALRAGSEGTPDYQDDRPDCSIAEINLDRDYCMSNLKQNLESVLKYGFDSFLHYVFSTLDYVRPLDESYRKIFPLLKYAEAGFVDYGYQPDNPENDTDEEYVSAKKLLEAIRIKARIVGEIEKLEADVKTKLGVIRRMQNYTFDPHKYRPEHGEIETLYHATAFVPEILRNGFSSERPNDRKGVGSFGQQSEISFTHDLEIARNIMRSLKEIWMITHGQLTAPQILGWCRAEGIDQKIFNHWKTETSDPVPGRNADPRKVVKLYRLWQWFTKTRINPVLISPWEIVDTMEHRKLSDIGVLACQVRLEQNDEYLHGEAEFRVKADRVLSVKQVLI